jgi:hypothetical protein
MCDLGAATTAIAGGEDLDVAESPTWSHQPVATLVLLAFPQIAIDRV